MTSSPTAAVPYRCGRRCCDYAASQSLIPSVGAMAFNHRRHQLRAGHVTTEVSGRVCCRADGSQTLTGQSGTFPQHRERDVLQLSWEKTCIADGDAAWIMAAAVLCSSVTRRTRRTWTLHTCAKASFTSVAIRIRDPDRHQN